jgi:hypothetical protein
MKISLWQLNESYQALVRLASQPLPKDQHSLAWKLSRIISDAKRTQQDLNESLVDLMAKCGFREGDIDIGPTQIDDFNRQSKKFMRETSCKLWGDPIQLSEIIGHVSISPLDLANLDWLIIEDAEENPKAVAAEA